MASKEDVGAVSFHPEVDPHVEVMEPQITPSSMDSLEITSTAESSRDGNPAHEENQRLPSYVPRGIKPSEGAGVVGVRHRSRQFTSSGNSLDNTDYNYATDLDFEIMHQPENEIEARRMANNYMFGFRKWKSHVSSRPLEARSQVVQNLYKDAYDKEIVSLCSFGNVVYVILFGWWVALVYLMVAILMAVSILGFKYSKFCISLAIYFLWPFGKFVHKNIPENQALRSTVSPDEDSSDSQNSRERSPLNPTSSSHNYDAIERGSEGLGSPRRSHSFSNPWNHQETGFWRRPESYIWVVLGLPILTVTHAAAFFLCWLPIVSIPTAKVHLNTIRKLLLLPPELLRIQHSSLSHRQASGDIIMYTFRAFNSYYYKYTVDGMNVFFVNMMFFVVISLFAGYLDEQNKYFAEPVKFTLASLSIIPLAYYIGMGVSSVSAQSSPAIGAVVNASFGSVVEIILYLTALYKGKKESKMDCYQTLVKAGLVGTLLATTLLIPGLAMVIGGIKHRAQRFNPTAAGVTATLLFVSVAAVFAPSIFSQSYAMMKCDECRAYNISNTSEGLACKSCHADVLGVPEGDSMYQNHVLPLIYTCSVLLPLAYILGLVYSLKTHRAVVHDAFVAEVGAKDHGNDHGTAQWSRLKSCLILLVSVVLMSLCADIVTHNIQPLLGSGLSVYFVGVTFLALVPDIPEIVIGIQFALQNNISLSVEVGSCIAVQVCMLQIPILVFANLIYWNGFYMLFSEIHIWTVVIGVLLNNYVFQDGKSNYFQGSALVLTYCALVAMYFFAPDPPGLKC